MDTSTGENTCSTTHILTTIVSRYEAQECCVNNYGFLAQPSSQAEHDLIKTRLQTSEFPIFD